MFIKCCVLFLWALGAAPGRARRARAAGGGSTRGAEAARLRRCRSQRRRGSRAVQLQLNHLHVHAARGRALAGKWPAAGGKPRRRDAALVLLCEVRAGEQQRAHRGRPRQQRAEPAGHASQRRWRGARGPARSLGRPHHTADSGEAGATAEPGAGWPERRKHRVWLGRPRSQHRRRRRRRRWRPQPARQCKPASVVLSTRRLDAQPVLLGLSPLAARQRHGRRRRRGRRRRQLAHAGPRRAARAAADELVGPRRRCAALGRRVPRSRRCQPLTLALAAASPPPDAALGLAARTAALRRPCARGAPRPEPGRGRSGSGRTLAGDCRTRRGRVPAATPHALPRPAPVAIPRPPRPRIARTPSPCSPRAP